jgi:hypothetical protein
MNNFFANVPLAGAQRLEKLSRLAFELREDAARLLAPYGVDDPAALLERIRARELPEQPAYDDYLGAKILVAGREAVRAELATVMHELGG